ncbi:hypothetical protein BD410DRAFT_739913 [Rickenella mellea]|uniref:dual-specificity kinase n=1 Tax=Rickenella mellea TaxID=50990 RepID=A0A4Y7QIV6_9AGAM|nr:hypothetical protein BD410DRAFT_739913 [Rickenella mellea]
MSSPSSSRPLLHDTIGLRRRRDRPERLNLSDSKPSTDDDIPGVDHSAEANLVSSRRPPALQVSLSELTIESEPDIPRSTSATSSLDPYYFTISSRNHSPIPPLPDGAPLSVDTCSDSHHPELPLTPAKDPASIDRHDLIGVGDLATPRWKVDENTEDATGMRHVVDEEFEQNLVQHAEETCENHSPESPWTIEAVDGEIDESDKPEEDRTERSIRTRSSMTEESGGEEILYPRKPLATEGPSTDHDLNSLPALPGLTLPSQLHPRSHLHLPPSAFTSPTRKAKKRTSDEFAMDHSGFLISKISGSSHADASVHIKGKEEKLSSRKHRSLGLGILSTSGPVRDRVKDKRKGDEGGTSKSGSTRAEKLTRHASVSSSSSNQGEPHVTRRGHATADFSHLPPSPSSSSIQQFLKFPTSAAGNILDNNALLGPSKDKDQHSSPNVAHSLLRGTQEGWEALDDEATVEALRKLDGISGKTARARGSIGTASRTSNHSRPVTPGALKGVTQWEGVEGYERVTQRSSMPKADVASSKDLESTQVGHESGSDKVTPFSGVGILPSEVSTRDDDDHILSNTEEIHASSHPPERTTSRKSGSTSARSSFTPKRGSVSSTNYTGTPTTSSRDSASLSAATSVTSISGASGRQSMGKARRNSTSSDVSSVHSSDATSQRDRAAFLASSGDATEDNPVPPVPPLPKDLSHYKSPPQSSTSLVFPSVPPVDDIDKGHELDDDGPLVLDANREMTHSPNRNSNIAPQQTALQVSGSSFPQLSKVPVKKWSLSALSLKRSTSPSSPAPQNSVVSPVSRRSIAFGKGAQTATSREPPRSPALSSKTSTGTWSPIQNGAMASATSLASLSSSGSVLDSSSPTSPVPRLSVTTSSHPGGSSPASTESTNMTTVSLSAVEVDESPSSKKRRESSTKRLTPSAIPFFRRSSSQSMQITSGPTTSVLSTSPTFSSAPNSSSHLLVTQSASSPMTPITPGSAQKKSSMLSLGLPSLLKGSASRKSLQLDRSDFSSRETEKTKRKSNGGDKLKKDENNRSESRISVLMGRKRGKTLSSTDPKKAKPIVLPPIQMTAIPSTTAQRVANLKSPPLTSSSSSSSAAGVTRTTITSTSRVTSQTVSSLQKQQDSLRGSGHQLPTIAGSPSVHITGKTAETQTQESNEPPSSLTNSVTASGSTSVVKETPTKIPRIASRSSTVTSPGLKNPSLLVPRRTSLIQNTSTNQVEDVNEPGMKEFGVVESTDPAMSQPASATANHRNSIRTSPSGSSRMNRQSSIPSTSASTATTLGANSRKLSRDSVSFGGLRKSSTGSVASMTSAALESMSSHRLSALSPSKGLNKLLSPKMSLPTTRLTGSSTTPNIHQTLGSPSPSRQSLSTPSPIPNGVDEEELLGDEEMMQYIKRQQARRLANGAKKEELDELLRFPEPQPPATPLTPTSVLRSSQHQYLSEYERKEILDFPSVYCIGARSDKKMATLDNPTNNFSYDDERGDYLVVNHDHLAYRYEIIDTLGKGSFGQVLHCRDHRSGESVAIKIIRNKKRFHHQALVEIKILENLCRWDPEEKHHVIKMTEHFHFRNHLCIATELLSINLYELIKANGFTGFTTTLIRRFTSQMLLSLSLMRHHRIVHCDLKPENVLLRHPAKSGIKVIDFGSSCFEHEKVYTYIQSRFYRSPEVILGMNYNMAIDMWSLGCILAELFTGFPIFPGENEQEQLSCIMEVLGVPDKDLINRSSRKRLFFDSTGTPRPVVNSKGRRRRPGTKTLVQVLRCDDELFVDFISKCLIWDPERRLKPQAALRHPFLTANKRLRPANGSPAPPRGLLPSSTMGISRTKPLTETPKKAQISAPTPLTARSSRLHSTQIPPTPVGSSSHPTIASSKSFRTSQQVTYHSSRSMNSFVTTNAGD